MCPLKSVTIPSEVCDYPGDTSGPQVGKGKVADPDVPHHSWLKILKKGMGWAWCCVIRTEAKQGEKRRMEWAATLPSEICPSYHLTTFSSPVLCVPFILSHLKKKFFWQKS